ncbi:MAG: peptide-methionine (S)-S-oxide reductase, partial [Candidatus Thermoplasmatota archaeon]
MIRNRRYIRIMLSFLVAILMVSTVFGVYGPKDTDVPEDMDETESLVTGEIPEIDKNQQENYSTATFATRCFWGPDARLGVEEGVIRTRIGFLEVKGSVLDDSGLKREAVRVDYDSEKITHQELYDIVWEN